MGPKPGRSLNGHQTHVTAPNESFARKVGHKLFINVFLDAIAALRVGRVLSSMAGGTGCSGESPNTASELANTTMGFVFKTRQASSKASVASRLLHMPRSKSASHSPLTAPLGVWAAEVF